MARTESLYEKMDIVEVAKLLRKELAASFPTAKFSVRIDRYSMGESIDVHWTNGPASIKVDELLAKFASIDYDPYSGEILSGGNRYVHSHRTVTEEIRKQEEEIFRRGWGEYNLNNYQHYTTVWHKISSTDYP